MGLTQVDEDDSELVMSTKGESDQPSVVPCERTCWIESRSGEYTRVSLGIDSKNQERSQGVDKDVVSNSRTGYRT